MTDDARTARTRAVITRLFAENSPQVDKPGAGEPDRPAMDVHVLLRGAPMQFSGILSTTPEGTLKLMTPVPGKAGDAPVMIEQFFDYADVASIALVREVKTSMGSSLWTPGSPS